MKYGDGIIEICQRISSWRIYLFEVIKSSTKYFTEAATEEDPHSWWEKACLKICSNSRRNAVKNVLYTVAYIFYFCY